MTQKVNRRSLRIVDHVAELLEERGAKMSPSAKAQADILRNAAKIYRAIDNPKMVTVSEVLPEVKKSNRRPQK